MVVAKSTHPHLTGARAQLLHRATFKPGYRITRRGIQIALGIIWIIDGILQLQPQMFTPAFANNVIAGAASGQPGYVTGPMQFFIHIFLLQPALFNSLIAITQLSLGVLILWNRSAGFGLWCSIVWGLFVWYIGEGLGGLGGGHTLLLMGAPGAALIYVLLAMGTLPVHKHPKNAADQRPAYWLVVAWAAVWTLGSVYQLLPGQNTIINVTAMIQANASGTPEFLALIDNEAASKLAGLAHATPPMAMTGMSMTNGGSPTDISMTPAQAASGRWFLLILTILQIVIGFGVFMSGLSRWFAVLLGCLLASAYWVIGQSMGSYFSGLATDPSTGPLFVLLGVTVLGCTQHDKSARQYIAKLMSKLAKL